MSSVWVYDIETYQNYFSVTFKDVNTKEIKEFIIFEDKNDFTELMIFITDMTKWLVGYNSYSFDNQLLSFMKNNEFDFSLESSNYVTYEIYKVAKMIIENKEFREYRYNLPFKFIDLMKAGMFMKSLKLIGVSMKWPRLQDLPIPFDTLIKQEDVETIRSYNLNDVLITEQLYFRMRDRIILRANISSMYDINCYTESDSGIANRVLEKFYSEATGLPKANFMGLRTERKFIKFNWVVFDQIHFETDELNILLEELLNYTYYKDTPFFKKQFIFKGTQYKLGVGGIHSVDNGAVFEETDDYYIIDADIDKAVSG